VNKTSGDFIRNLYASRLESGLLTITGSLTPVQVKKEIEQTKVMLVPSTVENLPYSIIESMARGKVVLASAQGGQKEIIRDGFNGFLFDYEQPSSFEEKIHGTYKLTPAKIASIGIEAKSTIKNECNPQAYFSTKIEILNKQVMQVKHVFPFVSEFVHDKTNDPFVESNELLSVVVPYYNMGKYIDETVRSIDTSIYPEKQIIIVNDGSSDQQSIDVLASFRSKPGVTVIDQANMGLSTARNRGAQEAKGKYLAFLDADDRVDKSYFQNAINVLNENSNVHFVGCWVQYFGGSKSKWPAFNPEPPYLLYHNMINSSSLVYRRSSFLQFGLNDAQFTYGIEDYDSVISLIKNGCRGVVIPEFLFFYRVRKDSMARGFNKSNQLYLQQLLVKKHKQFYATFAAELFGLLNANGPGINLDNPTLDYHLTEKIPVAGSVSKKLIYLVKKNSVTRKMAYKIYRLLNK